MTKDDLNSLSWPAMRYALGRKTYVVDTVCRALKNNAKNIRQDIRARMCEEIKKAIEANQCGMGRERVQWESLIEALENK